MITNQHKNLSRLQGLFELEEQIHNLQLGERDFEYRNHLEGLRLRVVAQIELETNKTLSATA